MELPQLGQRCDQIDCKQLDFLPLQCECGKQFCTAHFNSHSQTCKVFGTQTTQELRKFTNDYKCSSEGCTETSLVPLICTKCQNHFCVKHRHFNDCADDQNAIARYKEKAAATLRDFNKAKTAVDDQIQHNLMRAKRKGKNKNLVNQVQLMKIKSKAKGSSSIPTADRIYFNVKCSGHAQGNPVFVSKTWSIGRAIDSIANECNLTNENNKSTSKKLRLFKDDTGAVVTKELSTALESLLNDATIANGESLIAEYVDNDCEFVERNA